MLSLEQSLYHYNNLFGCGEPENPDYWPIGFIPILWGSGGDYVLINSLVNSSTYGAVYEMTDGVGSNRVSSSLSDFLDANSQILEMGLVEFKNPEYSTILDNSGYLMACRKAFRESPYFSRLGGEMDKQIVDWK